MRAVEAAIIFRYLVMSLFAINSFACCWLRNDPVGFRCKDDGALGPRFRSYRGTYPRAHSFARVSGKHGPCSRLGSGQAWQANVFGKLLSHSAVGGSSSEASLPCLTIGKYFLSFFHLCSVHPQPQSPTPAKPPFPQPSTSIRRNFLFLSLLQFSPSTPYFVL